MTLKEKISKYISIISKIKINSKDAKMMSYCFKGKKYHGNQFIEDAFEAEPNNV